MNDESDDKTKPADKAPENKREDRPLQPSVSTHHDAPASIKLGKMRKLSKVELVMIISSHTAVGVAHGGACY